MTDHAERDLLLDLAYGELDDRAARRVREHVAGCAWCRAELDELQGTRRLMSALPELPAPERGERILVAAAREAADRARRPRALLPRWLVPGLALAATVTLVSVVSLRLAREQEGPLAPEDERALMKAAPAPAEVAAPAAPAAAALAEKQDAGPAKDEAAREAAPRPAASRYAQAPPPPPVRSAPEPATPRTLELRRERAATGAAASNAAEPIQAEELAVRDDAKGEGVVGGVAGFAGQPGAAPGEAEADAAVASAPAPAPAAAPPEAAKRAAATSERKAAAPRAVREQAAPDAPLAQAVVVRTFPGCAGETRREIRRDLEGRVRWFIREGVADGRAVRVELDFDIEGALTASRGRDLATGAAVPADVLPGLPRSAAQVDPDAPPRCGP